MTTPTRTASMARLPSALVDVQVALDAYIGARMDQTAGGRAQHNLTTQAVNETRLALDNAMAAYLGFTGRAEAVILRMLERAVRAGHHSEVATVLAHLDRIRHAPSAIHEFPAQALE